MTRVRVVTEPHTYGHRTLLTTGHRDGNVRIWDPAATARNCQDLWIDGLAGDVADFRSSRVTVTPGAIWRSPVGMKPRRW